jgi:hypothetical protein
METRRHLLEKAQSSREQARRARYVASTLPSPDDREQILSYAQDLDEQAQFFETRAADLPEVQYAPPDKPAPDAPAAAEPESPDSTDQRPGDPSKSRPEPSGEQG